MKSDNFLRIAQEKDLGINGIFIEEAIKEVPKKELSLEERAKEKSDLAKFK